MTLKVKRLLYDVQAANTSGRLDTDFPHNQVATNLNRELGEKKMALTQGFRSLLRKMKKRRKKKSRREKEGRKRKRERERK